MAEAAAPPFRYTEKQRLARDLIASDATHCLLYGGARSGKSYIAVDTIIKRAIYSAGSRHLMARFRLAHIKASIVADTWPKVMRLGFPELTNREVEHRKGEGYFRFWNGSEVWYAGLDEKERTEKILGQEYATLLLEECSQIPWASRELLITRMAQKTGDADGHRLRLKALYSENPPLKSHWSYKLFIEKVSPDTNKRLREPGDYGSLQMNPADNEPNIAPETLRQLRQLGERRRKRFLEGQFGEAGEEALWTPELIEQQRLSDDRAFEPDDLVRVVVAVDPSGADNADDAASDEIGIVCAGLLKNGTAIVLQDRTMKGSPAEWGAAAVALARDWECNLIVAEENYGGAMVRSVIQTASAEMRYPVRYQPVHATRGKHIRAEPISALYEQQRVWHMAGLERLEDELCQMTTFGFTGEGSPNRADACLVGSTLVSTGRGDIPIKDVRVGDLVLTRGGPKTVLESRMTRPSARTFEIIFSDGRHLQATGEHPVFVVGRGFVRVDALVCGDMVEPIENWSDKWTIPSPLNSMVKSSHGIRIPLTAPLGSTTFATMISTIVDFGRSTRERFRKDGISTTRTLIRSTTLSTIWSQCRQAITLGCTLLKSVHRNLASTLIECVTRPQHGMQALLVSNGIGNTERQVGLVGKNDRPGFVKHAGRRSSPGVPWTLGFVQKSAADPYLMRLMPMRTISSVPFAARSSGRTNIGTGPKRAPVYVERICASGVEPVFNLEVEEEHEFFANGVLVHNCVWAITSLFPSVVKAAKDEGRSGGAPRVNLGFSSQKRRGYGNR